MKSIRNYRVTNLVSACLPVVAIVAILILWEVLVRVLHIPIYLLPAPSVIFQSALEHKDLLLINSMITLWEVLAGFAVAVLVGIPLAALIVYSKLLERLLYPPLIAAQAIPKVAIAPLFIVWLGFGTAPKIIMAFLVAFFPIVVDTVLGLRSPSMELIDLARAMGSNNLQIFFKFRFPSALPNIFVGLKVAITLAVVGALVGEFVGSSEGIGHTILVAQGMVDTKMVYAAIIMISALGMILFGFVSLIEKAVLPWRKSLDNIHEFSA